MTVLILDVVSQFTSYRIEAMFFFFFLPVWGQVTEAKCPHFPALSIPCQHLRYIPSLLNWGPLYPVGPDGNGEGGWQAPQS